MVLNMKSVHLHTVELDGSDRRRLRSAREDMNFRTKLGQRTRLIPGVGTDTAVTGLLRQLMRDQGDLH